MCASTPIKLRRLLPSAASRHGGFCHCSFAFRMVSTILAQRAALSLPKGLRQVFRLRRMGKGRLSRPSARHCWVSHSFRKPVQSYWRLTETGARHRWVWHRVEKLVQLHWTPTGMCLMKGVSSILVQRAALSQLRLPQKFFFREGRARGVRVGPARDIVGFDTVWRS